MRLAYVTDEIDENIDEALSVGLAAGIRHVEIRSVGGRRLCQLDDEEIGRLAAELRKTGVEVDFVSPGYFKLPVPGGDEAGSADLLRRAEQLGCRRIHIFACRRDALGEEKQRLPGRIASLADAAAERGMEILLENSPGTVCRSNRETAELVELVNRKNMGVNWDPGNSYTGTGRYMDDLKLLESQIRNVHVKDVIRLPDGKPRFVPVGEGEVDWRGILRYLRSIGYNGNLCIETHCRDKRMAFQRSLQWLKECGV